MTATPVRENRPFVARRPLRYTARMASPDLEDLARRHGVSVAAAGALLAALRATGGASAQFSHPDLGGAGQWMPGMVQVGDLFNTTLRARVDALCADLAAAVRGEPAGELRAESPGSLAPDAWWPAALGVPDTAGGQNDVRYAWFAGPRRLAVQRHGRVTLYDTGEHRVAGVSQQQPGAGGPSLAFSTRHGTLDLAALSIVQS